MALNKPADFRLEGMVFLRTARETRAQTAVQGRNGKEATYLGTKLAKGFDEHQGGSKEEKPA